MALDVRTNALCDEVARQQKEDEQGVTRQHSGDRGLNGAGGGQPNKQNLICVSQQDNQSRGAAGSV